MTFASPGSGHDQIKKLARLIDQAGSILVVDAALISPSEREQIERASRGETQLFNAMAQWDPQLHAMLAELSLKSQGWGSLQHPPDYPKPAYAALFEASLRELGLLTPQQPPPWAYWQAMAEGLAAEPQRHWLAVEPCQWLVSTQEVQLRLCRPYQPLSPQLVETIKAALDWLDASLVLSPSGRAYLGFEKPFDLQSAWPETLEGLGADGFLPQGSQASDWRRFVTELEMALAITPDSSDTQSLWPWGMGAPLAPGSPVAFEKNTGLEESGSALFHSAGLTDAPLPLQGLHQWLAGQGRHLAIEWRSFKKVQSVEDWLAEWALLLADIQALRRRCMAANGQPARPWAVLLQDQWSYKLHVQPEGRGRQDSSAFPGMVGLIESLRGLTQSFFASQGGKGKKNHSLLKLLQLASWDDGNAG